MKTQEKIEEMLADEFVRIRSTILRVALSDENPTREQIAEAISVGVLEGFVLARKYMVQDIERVLKR